MRTLITHELTANETWADYSMDQPNPVFTHDESFVHLCTACVLRGLA